MIASGDFPHPGQRSDHTDSPRVGDGFVRVDPRRSGDLRQPQRAVGLPPARADRRPRRPGPRRPHPRPGAGRAAPRRGDALRGPRRPQRPRHRAGQRVAVLIMRAIPLRPNGEAVGGAGAAARRTDIRSRDRELVTKDATIREIHHRVKNNLQTVAALLRLQARRLRATRGAGRAGGGRAPGRLDRDRARDAEPVRGGERRLRRRRRPAAPGGHRAGQPRAAGRTVRRAGCGAAGTFGSLDAEVATPLSMALTELLQNAVEHGFGGVRSRAASSCVVRRTTDRLAVEVLDDGVGVPDGFDPAGGQPRAVDRHAPWSRSWVGRCDWARRVEVRAARLRCWTCRCGREAQPVRVRL